MGSGSGVQAHPLWQGIVRRTKKGHLSDIVMGLEGLPAIVTQWQVEDVYFSRNAVHWDKTRNKIKPPPVIGIILNYTL